MKGKARMIAIAVAPLIVIGLIAASLFFVKRSSQTILLLEELESDGEYQYREIEWGSSVDEVRQAFSQELEKDPAFQPAEDSPYTNYISAYNYIWDGKAASATVEFCDGKLQMISFGVKAEDGNEEWFEKQVQALIELYGEESRKKENSSEVYQSTGYSWETENTKLNITLVGRKTGELSVVLAIGLK